MSVQTGFFQFRKWGFPGGSVVKNLPTNAGDTRDAGSILGSGRSPGVGNGNPLQYSCLENPIGRRAWWVIDHRVAKSRTQLSVYAHANIHTHTHTHTQRRLEACSDISSICLLHVTSCLNDYPSLLPVQSCSPPTPPPETPACSLSILEGLPTAC